jgi:hypothetical protein
MLLSHLYVRRRLFPIFEIARQSVFNRMCWSAAATWIALTRPVSDDDRRSKSSLWEAG